ncbi:MAG: O-antigen ligase family protein, partial [Phycisphaerae bacterium]|nr:O-antigen ligase family protein [Phycisphaerae bacterium]
MIRSENVMTSSESNHHESSSIGIAMAQQRDQQTRMLDRWLIALVAVTIGACCLLLSAGSGPREGMQPLKEGMRPWAPNSILKGVVDLLNFNGAYPTFRGIGVKYTSQYIGAAVMLATAGLAWFLRSRRDDGGMLPRLAADDSADQAGADRAEAGQAGADQAGARQIDKTSSVPTSSWRKKQLDPATVAQWALLAFAGWAVLSAKWAHFGPGAFNEGVKWLMLVIWAVALGRTLSKKGVFYSALAMVVVLLATAVLGLAYYYERNPVMRLEFPIGGPIFFAACMLPALILCLAGLAAFIERLVMNPSAVTNRITQSASIWPWYAIALGAVVTLIVVGWACVLADSRSPAVALFVALMMGGVVWLVRLIAVPYRRVFLLGVIVAVLIGTVFVGRPWWQRQLHVQEGGRGASLRLRLYAWKYAYELFTDRPSIGHGQGGFFLLSQQQASALRSEAGYIIHESSSAEGSSDSSSSTDSAQNSAHHEIGRSDLERDPQAFQAQ